MRQDVLRTLTELEAARLNATAALTRATTQASLLPPSLVSARIVIERCRAALDERQQALSEAQQTVKTTYLAREAASGFWARLVGSFAAAEKIHREAQDAEAVARAMVRAAGANATAAERSFAALEKGWTQQRAQEQRTAQDRLKLIEKCEAIFRNQPALRRKGFAALAAEADREIPLEAQDENLNSGQMQSRVPTFAPRRRRRIRSPGPR